MRRVPDTRWRTLPRAATFGVTLVLAFAAIVGAAVLTVVPALFLVAGWLVVAVGVYLSARLAIAAHFRRRIAVATLAVLTVAGGVSLLWPETEPAPAKPPGMQTLQLRTGSTLAYLELHGPDRGLGSTAGAKADLEAAGRDLPPASRMESRTRIEFTAYPRI